MKRQKMLATLSTIKSVSIQVKDIKYMIYSQNQRLISFYAKFNFSNNSSFYDDNDYILISKSSDLNKSLIYALINTDWLINADEIKSKTVGEIKQECIGLQNKIFKLSEKQKHIIDHSDIDKKIKLFQYWLSCLTEFLINEMDSEIVSSQIIKKLEKD